MFMFVSTPSQAPHFLFDKYSLGGIATLEAFVIYEVLMMSQQTKETKSANRSK